MSNTTTPKSRKCKARPAVPEPILFPNSAFIYQIAVEGPVGPGGVAHRIKRYPIRSFDRHGREHVDELLSGACLPTTVEPVSGYDPDINRSGSGEQTVPVTQCLSFSVGFAQTRGVRRCTNDLCWPVTPDETTPGGRR